MPHKLKLIDEFLEISLEFLVESRRKKYCPLFEF